MPTTGRHYLESRLSLPARFTRRTGRTQADRSGRRANVHGLRKRHASPTARTGHRRWVRQVHESRTASSVFSRASTTVRPDAISAVPCIVTWWTETGSSPSSPDVMKKRVDDGTGNVSSVTIRPPRSSRPEGPNSPGRTAGTGPGRRGEPLPGTRPSRTGNSPTWATPGPPRTLPRPAGRGTAPPCR